MSSTGHDTVIGRCHCGYRPDAGWDMYKHLENSFTCKQSVVMIPHPSSYVAYALTPPMPCPMGDCTQRWMGTVPKMEAVLNEVITLSWQWPVGDMNPPIAYYVYMLAIPSNLKGVDSETSFVFENVTGSAGIKGNVVKKKNCVWLFDYYFRICARLEKGSLTDFSPVSLRMGH